MKKTLASFLLCTLPALAAVTGTVINRTTGLPAAGATVALNKLGEGGIEMIDQAKSDAEGKFTINQELSGPPHLLRTAFDGVTYNHMLPPGTPTTGLTLDVYNSSKLPGSAKVSKHMLLFQPNGGQMDINETYLFTNDGITAWNDPANGTLHFFLPPGAGGKATVEATAPGGMPIGAPLAKSSKPDIYQVDFPVKPGDTRIDLTYSLPYTAGEPYSGKIVTQDQNTYLIAPAGVTMTGEGLTDLGDEPRTQAHLFGFSGGSYKIQLTGSPSATPASADNGGGGESDGSPQLEQIMPRLYSKTIPILAVALGILALGFALLYRAGDGTAKESNERGRG